VITGGEPMLFAELVSLCGEMHARGMHLTIETAGTRFLSLACDLLSISPKRANSTPTPQQAGDWSARHERTRHAPEVIRRLVAEYHYQFKFVIDDPADCDDVEAYLEEFPEIDRARVLLMPQGTTTARLSEIGAWLEPHCAARGYTFCPRKQIEWYGLARGT
jgi:7-carboxy-7-deazaguanine synthase